MILTKKQCQKLKHLLECHLLELETGDLVFIDELVISEDEDQGIYVQRAVDVVDRDGLTTADVRHYL